MPRESSNGGSGNATGGETAAPSASVDPRLIDTADGAFVPSLAVSGLYVTKADLLTALRLYVPQVTDIVQQPDGGFLLRVVPGEQ
jgi:hypothetical protein